jgi:hypothetical protein
LRFEHYQQYALHFAGDRNDFDYGWNGFNRVFGCYFFEIGNLASSGDSGYGALDLVNSIDNAIRNNELHCGYFSGLISTFYYFQGETYVPAWCDDHLSEGWSRLYTSGNSKTCS